VRLNFGGPESSESLGVVVWGGGAELADEAERRRTIVAELLGSIGASVAGEGALVELLEVELFEALSEPDEALRNFGRSLSSLLLEEVLDELAVLSSELEEALCNFGRSGSLSLFEESSELELARRNWGRSPDVGVPDELLAELVDEDLVMGRVGSSVACDAAARSSSVPSFTIARVWAL
jgi:hypothetical protein